MNLISHLFNDKIIVKLTSHWLGDFTMEIVNEVQKFRKKKNLTQESLAQKVGVTRRTIVSLEKGNYIPSLLLALQIAETLEQDINDIFYLKKGK